MPFTYSGYKRATLLTKKELDRMNLARAKKKRH